MQVQYCEFPDDVYFDVESDVWLKPLPDNSARMGITTILSFLAGHVEKINLKTSLSEARQGQSVATIESGKYFGAIRSPVRAKIHTFNQRVEVAPRLVNDSPYEEGWIAEFEDIDEASLPTSLLRGKVAASSLDARINSLKIKCFKRLPNNQIISVGVECSATLANLNEVLSKAPVGEVVHVVSDDPFAEIEMIRWEDQTKHQLLETRRERNLSHFLVEKRHA